MQDWALKNWSWAKLCRVTGVTLYVLAVGYKLIGGWFKVTGLNLVPWILGPLTSSGWAFILILPVIAFVVYALRSYLALTFSVIMLLAYVLRNCLTRSPADRSHT